MNSKPGDFLTNFHKKHFDDNTPIYGKEVFYKLLEELAKKEDG